MLDDLQAFLDRAPVARTQRRTDAGTDIEHLVFDVIGFGKPLDDVARQRVHAFAVGNVADDHCEFVAAQAAHDLAFDDQAFQPRGDFAKHAVADQVSKRIVDCLEPVEVDHEKRTARAPFGGIFERLAQRLVEHAAVGQLGQRVVARKIFDLLRGFALLGDIGADPAEPLIGSHFVDDRCARQLPPAVLAVDRDPDHEV